MSKFISSLMGLTALVTASTACPATAQIAKVAMLFDVSWSMTSVWGKEIIPLQRQFTDFESALDNAKSIAKEGGDLCPVQLVAVAWSTTQKVILDNNITNTEELEEAGNVIGRATGFSSQDTPHSAAIGSALSFLGVEGSREIFLTTDELPSFGVVPLLTKAKGLGIGITLVVYRGEGITAGWIQAFKEAGISTARVLDISKGSEGLEDKVREIFLHCVKSA